MVLGTSSSAVAVLSLARYWDAVRGSAFEMSMKYLRRAAKEQTLESRRIGARSRFILIINTHTNLIKREMKVLEVGCSSRWCAAMQERARERLIPVVFHHCVCASDAVFVVMWKESIQILRWRS